MPKNSSAKYYQKNKERLQKRVCESYQNLSKEEKKVEYGHEQRENLPKDEKQSLDEYRKKYEMTRNETASQQKAG